MKSIKCFTLVFLLGSIELLFAQSEDYHEAEVSKSELAELLDLALSLAEKGLWKEAFQTLDDAEKLDPMDSRIQSYRISFQELSALDEAQKRWISGEKTEVKLPESEVESPSQPKFVINREKRDEKENPVKQRDSLRIDFSLKLFALDTQTLESRNVWLTGNEFIFSSLGLDARYWMPFLGKTGGFSLRSSGYSWTQGSPSYLLNSLDLGTNLRGFILERALSRLETGIDFGVSLHTKKAIDTEFSPVLFLGFWAQDPVLYHVLRINSLERLVFGGGLRIYLSTREKTVDLVDYRIESSWYFDHAYVGLRFEWWVFTTALDRSNMFSPSFFSGIRY